MRRILFGLAAGLLGLALTSSVADAHGGHGGRGGFRGGYRGGHVGRYVGHRWGRCVWSPVYNRYQYWDTTLNCYFYYDAGCGGYVRCP